jgi:putative transposase
VEPACAVLEIASSTYYAAKKREENPPPRDVRDEELKKEIMRVWKEKGREVCPFTGSLGLMPVLSAA